MVNGRKDVAGGQQAHRPSRYGCMQSFKLNRRLKLRLHKTAIELMRPVIRTAWEVLGLTTRSQTPADSENQLAIAIHSFDGYKRFWMAARFFTERAIPPSFPIYYISERIPMHPDPARCILTGPGGFTTRLATGLDAISRSHKYVLYLQEDIWMNDPLSAEVLSHFIQSMEKESIDCLKLGYGVMKLRDRESLIRGTDHLPGSDNMRWYGPNNYSMSHHCSIFRSDFFLRTALLAKMFGQERPHLNELFVSEALKRQMKARNSDSKKIRVAVWERAPSVSYTHACIQGRLTPEGRELLEKHGVSHLYDETSPGEILTGAAQKVLQV
jgi:hypothetical protein